MRDEKEEEEVTRGEAREGEVSAGKGRGRES